MIELIELLLTTLGSVFRSRKRLILENLLLRQQLQVALRCQRRPRLRTRDKLFWLLVRHLFRNWRRHLLLVRPETVLRWHRQGWRLFWQWRSHHPLGRPRLTAELRSLIATMARENPHWGTERIRGELLKLWHRRECPLHPPSPKSWASSAAQPELARLPRQPCPDHLGS
jgi:putative transposase